MYKSRVNLSAWRPINLS